MINVLSQLTSNLKPGVKHDTRHDVSLLKGRLYEKKLMFVFVSCAQKWSQNFMQTNLTKKYDETSISISYSLESVNNAPNLYNNEIHDTFPKEIS